MRIEINTTQFEFAHGKRPKGYGQWGFYFDRQTDPMFFTGKYSEAKGMAVAWARTKGHHTITLGS